MCQSRNEVACGCVLKASKSNGSWSSGILSRNGARRVRFILRGRKIKPSGDSTISSWSPGCAPNASSTRAGNVTCRFDVILTSMFSFLTLMLFQVRLHSQSTGRSDGTVFFSPSAPVSGTGTGSLIPLPSRERGFSRLFCLVVCPTIHLWIDESPITLCQRVRLQRGFPPTRE